MSVLAEKNVIGSLLLDPGCMDKIKLEPEMFTNELDGRLFLEFLRGYENNYTVNAVVLAAKVTDFPADMVQAEIRGCLEQTLTSADVQSYADIVRNEYRAAQFGKVLGNIRPDSAKVDEQMADTIAELESLMGERESKSKTLAEIAAENKGNYFCDNEQKRLYVGFPGIDDQIGGLEGGDVIVIGARPAVGKSALVTQMAWNLAQAGKKVGFYNLEMQEKQVYERFVVSQSGIGLTRLRRAKNFLGNERERFDKANELLENQNQIVITTGSKAVSDIRAESRHMGYDVIIVDYLQLLRADKAYKGNRYAEVGAVSRAIKGLAMELNIPIIALSQLNRASEHYETKEPGMSDLREAGDIEQDASVIMLMWNCDENDRSKKGFKVEKNRQGDTGKEILYFNGDLMRFEESNERPEDDENPFT